EGQPAIDDGDLAMIAQIESEAGWQQGRRIEGRHLDAEPAQAADGATQGIPGADTVDEYPHVYSPAGGSAQRVDHLGGDAVGGKQIARQGNLLAGLANGGDQAREELLSMVQRFDQVAGQQ